MKDEYKDIYGFDFYREEETVAGDRYRIVKDGSIIGKEVFMYEKDLLEWATKESQQ